MFLVYFLILIVAVFIIWATFWVTRKAYSRKWDQPDDE